MFAGRREQDLHDSWKTLPGYETRFRVEMALVRHILGLERHSEAGFGGGRGSKTGWKTPFTPLSRALALPMLYLIV